MRAIHIVYRGSGDSQKRTLSTKAILSGRERRGLVKSKSQIQN